MVPTRRFARRKQEALGLVEDPDDWAYVALALSLRRKYTNVLILTWNTRHFVEDKLEERGIFLATPEELLKALRLRYERKSATKVMKIRGVPVKVYRILVSVLPEEKQQV